MLEIFSPKLQVCSQIFKESIKGSDTLHALGILNRERPKLGSQSWDRPNTA